MDFKQEFAALSLLFASP